MKILSMKQLGKMLFFLWATYLTYVVVGLPNKARAVKFTYSPLNACADTLATGGKNGNSNIYIIRSTGRGVAQNDKIVYLPPGIVFSGSNEYSSNNWYGNTNVTGTLLLNESGNSQYSWGYGFVTCKPGDVMIGINFHHPRFDINGNPLAANSALAKENRTGIALDIMCCKITG